MKIQHLLAALLAVTAVSPAALALEVSPVLIDVKPVSQNHQSRYEGTTTKSLNVAVTNSSGEELALTLKYYFFSRSLQGGKLTLMKTGERPFVLKSHGIATVATETVSAKHVTAHIEGATQDTPQQRGNPGTRVPASGERIVGHAVQILQGGKVLVENFSEPSLKAQIGAGR